MLIRLFRRQAINYLKLDSYETSVIEIATKLEFFQRSSTSNVLTVIAVNADQKSLRKTALLWYVGVNLQIGRIARLFFDTGNLKEFVNSAKEYFGLLDSVRIWRR